MKYTIEFSPKAAKELVGAVVWYNEDQEKLGQRFEEEVLRKIDLIATDPLLYPVKRKIRETKTDKFPYLIVYRINDARKIIVIISLFHTGRHPKRKY